MLGKPGELFVVCLHLEINSKLRPSAECRPVKLFLAVLRERQLTEACLRDALLSALVSRTIDVQPSREKMHPWVHTVHIWSVSMTQEPKHLHIPRSRHVLHVGSVSRGTGNPCEEGENTPRSQRGRL